MTIEVLKDKNASNLDKGNLFESLAEEFLMTQGFKVTNQVRITASELDLYCEHSVSGKVVYVECKALKENLSVNVLHNLLGKIEFQDIPEGWLVSTGAFGKDAKGFMIEWEKKNSTKRSKLHLYTPDRVVEALLNSNIIKNKPESYVSSILQDNTFSIGNWILLISEWGKFWICPVLRNGIANSMILFDAKTGTLIRDENIFEKIKGTDFTLNSLNFNKSFNPSTQHIDISTQPEPTVIEVEFGEKWDDYRPARPEHFVGRKKAQKDLLKFFTDIKKNRTDTRIFAIKGDSGIGKSSLIAKIRNAANLSIKPNNLFLFAIDMRAADNSSYIHSSLMKALQSAANLGFGKKSVFELSNYSDPLQSESISSFLSECKRKHQLIIIIFDQFEELYSKSEMFTVFEEAKKLMFSTISASTNMILGFAWKTDSTVPQDHPAYHMWHQLSDHRFEISLKPFSHSDAEQSLNIFEKELGEKILPEIRKYLAENSQGYPWLLKKLCIHLYEQMKNGHNQHEIVNKSLDISSLFDQDLNNLTDQEMSCLKMIAKNTPIDWVEVIENVGPDIVQSLQNKRLVIKRGSKLNLYWDIFRDYVLTENIPTIPFTHIPQSPSLEALISVFMELNTDSGRSLKDLSNCTNFKESTLRNIIHDLEQFGIVRFPENLVIINNHIKCSDVKSLFSNIRAVIKRHALTELLRTNNTMKPASKEVLIEYLKSIKPTAQYHIRTWETYATRMITWLKALGFVKICTAGIIYEDFGEIVDGDVKKWKGERKRVVFLGDTSPLMVVQALDTLKLGPQSKVSMKNKGFRNACAILYRFRIIELTSTSEYQISNNHIELSSEKAIWDEATREESINLVIKILHKTPDTSVINIGQKVAENFNKDWTETSCKRIGRGLKQWANWLDSQNGSKTIPPPPGRGKQINNQPGLFDL